MTGPPRLISHLISSSSLIWCLAETLDCPLLRLSNPSIPAVYLWGDGLSGGCPLFIPLAPSLFSDWRENTRNEESASCSSYPLVYLLIHLRKRKRADDDDDETVVNNQQEQNNERSIELMIIDLSIAYIDRSTRALCLVVLAQGFSRKRGKSASFPEIVSF